jgi:branched-chain amino acid transport system substrate-binding protein
MPLFPQTGVAALQQLKNLGITAPIVGGDPFNSPEIAAIPEADGMVIVLSKIGENKELNDKIKAFTGKEAGLYTPYGYDAIKLLAEVFGKVGTDKEKVKEYLYQIKYENAVANPTISFDEAGDLKDGEAAIFIIKDKKIVPLVR